MNKLLTFFIANVFLLCSMISCTRVQKYSFTGDYSASQLKPTILISNSSDSTIKSENLIGGKIMIDGNLTKEGFYQITMHYDDAEKTKFKFPIWLSGEELEFHFSDKLEEYPIIKSQNIIQTDLNKYYSILKDESKEANIKLESALLRAKKFSEILRDDAHNQLYYDIDTAREKLENAQFISLEKFSKSKPSPQVLFFLIQNSSQDQINKHPESFLVLLKSIVTDFKDNIDYDDLVNSIIQKLRVSVGKKIAIKVFGNDVNGNAFNAKILNNKKIILIEFWKASNDISRNNRKDYKVLYKKYASKGFEIIGVSLDKKEDWWKTAIKQDEVNWPQFSDLKGSSSGNLTYYNIDVIPNNILLSADGEILDTNTPFVTLGIDLVRYLD